MYTFAVQFSKNLFNTFLFLPLSKPNNGSSNRKVDMRPFSPNYPLLDTLHLWECTVVDGDTPLET